MENVDRLAYGGAGHRRHSDPIERAIEAAESEAPLYGALSRHAAMSRRWLIYRIAADRAARVAG